MADQRKVLDETNGDAAPAPTIHDLPTALYETVDLRRVERERKLTRLRQTRWRKALGLALIALGIAAAVSVRHRMQTIAAASPLTDARSPARGSAVHGSPR